MEYGNHKKHSAGARNVKARAKRALLLPSLIRNLVSLVGVYANEWCKQNSSSTTFWEGILGF